MKKWIQKTAGLILSAFLALGLSSQAHAAEEEEPAQPLEIQSSQAAPVEEASGEEGKSSTSSTVSDADSEGAAPVIGISADDSVPATQDNVSNTVPDEDADSDETIPFVGIKANGSSPAAQDDPAGSDPSADTDGSVVTPVAANSADSSGSDDQDGPSDPDPSAGENHASTASTDGISVGGSGSDDQNGPSDPDPSAGEYHAGAVSTDGIGVGESTPAEPDGPSDPDPAAGTGSAVPAVTGESAPAQDDNAAGNVSVSFAVNGSVPGSLDFTVASADPDASPDGVTDPQEGTESSSPLLASDGETVPTVITLDGDPITDQEGLFYNEDTGEIALVNYDSADSSIVSTGPGGLVIAASGYNRIHSITSEGDVNVTGTGILLLDNVVLGQNSNFYLHTPVDIYEDGTGSVAVFINTGTNEYTLVNGSSMPGLLDEAYTITGLNLIIPSGSVLLLNSSGTVYNKETGEILFRYTGDEGDALLHEYGLLTDPDAHYFAGNDQYGVDETNGSLTIGAGASLTVDGTVRMEKTTGIKSWTENPVPLLSASSGSAIIVNGQITGDGRIEMKEGSSLSGSGSAEAYKITIDKTEVLSDCGVSLHADDEIWIFGGGTIPNLILDNTIVLFGFEGNSNTVTVSNLVSSGNSALVNYNRLTLGSVTNSGTVTLLSDTEYPSSGSVFDLNGSVNSGTLRLAGGIFHLGEQFALAEGASLQGEHVIVYDDYDYFGSSEPFSAPLIVSSDHVTMPVPSGASCAVPLVIVQTETRWVFGRRGTFITDTQESTAYFKNVGGKYVLDLGDASSYEGGENLITAALNGNWNNPVITIEFQEMDGNGNLSFRTVSYKDYELEDLDPEALQFELQNAYLVRITVSEKFWELPAGGFSSTSTAFTGSGILGGGGAGSLSGGSGNLINFGSSSSDPDPEPDDPVTPTPAGDSAGETSLWRVVVTDISDYHRVTCYNGTQEVINPGRKVTAKMNFVLPSGWDGQAIYAVFRNADGTLTAFKAQYTGSDGMLRFDTDLTGIFALVSFPFDGEPFSADFYAALEDLEIIRNLPVRR